MEELLPGQSINNMNFKHLLGVGSISGGGGLRRSIDPS